jgi:hypothetical protein
MTKIRIPDPLVRGMDPRIRIHTKMSWTWNTGFNSEQGPPLSSLSGGRVPGPMLRWRRAAWAGAACSWRGAGAAGCRAAPGPCPPPPRPPHRPSPPPPHAACSSAGLQHVDSNNDSVDEI